MPIRTITDKQYKGVSELYRISDGEVTGYYVTYRDSDGKPIKKRVDAANRDEALLRLNEIKQDIDLEKQGKTMSAPIIKPITKVIPEVEKSDRSFTTSKKTIVDHREVISEYKGVAIVSLLDIVAFDDINILYGYETGIRIVKTIENLIADTLNSLKEDGLFTKHGIDRFSYELFHVYADKLCLFIKNDFNHRLLEVIIKQLLTKISNHKFIISQESHIHLNVTFGATKADSSVSLIYAEKALKEAKRTHNSYIFHDSTSGNKNEHLIHKVYETLIDNIKEEKVTPHFQGIFDVNSDTVPYKFESLMRLMDRDGRVLSPVVFMEKSKEYRLYTQLMSQMIDKVFRVMENNDVAMTLNLSYIDISNPELCDVLIDKVKKMKIGRRLTVEIVESEQIEDIEMINEFIFSLKKLGVLIAIDDFGSGFSNFDNIVKLDVDYVKLDGSLVSKIHDEKYRIILENMVKICRDLGIKTIAEYISDDSISRLAKSIGVDYLQGYHLHKPEKWECVAETFGYVHS
jgi:EAL domain-containing protein (putative c-di-GMP-specific phosphodiesterase class I)/GGDEF domain-containing protein